MEVYVGMVTHSYGETFFTAADESTLFQEVVDWIRETGSDHPEQLAKFQDVLADASLSDHDRNIEAVTAYFHENDDWFSFGTAPLDISRVTR